MSLRIDTGEPIGGALVVGGTGLGVTGAQILAGTAGPPPGLMFNDVDAGDEAKEFRALIVTPPSAGTLFVREDGSFTLTGAPDGVYEVVYQLIVDGADLGLTTATITVGEDAAEGGSAGYLAISGSTSAGLIVSGSAAGGFTLGGVGTCSTLLAAGSVLELALSGTAYGVTAGGFASTGTFALTGAAQAVVPVSAVAAVTLTVSGSFSGTALVDGVSVQQLKLIGSAVASVVQPGFSSAGAFALTGSAVGEISIGVFSGAELDLSGLSSGTSSVSGASAGGLTLAGSASATLPTAGGPCPSAADIATAVRAELSAELLRILELAKIHGLVAGEPLSVTPTSRSAGDVVQIISESGDTVRVERA